MQLPACNKWLLCYKDALMNQYSLMMAVHGKIEETMTE